MSTHPFVRRFAQYLVQRESREDITWRLPAPMLPRLVSRGLFVLTLMIMSAACDSSPPIPPVQASSTAAALNTDFSADQSTRLTRLLDVLAEPAPADLSSGLLVRLAFDDVADLDLFVTDPLQESAYFANSPTRSGGRLVDDLRCDDPSPRVEAVHFAEPIAGRYRVGVDFHGRCEETSVSGTAKKEGLYIVRVEEGGRVLERSGILTPGRFEVIVIEFDVP